jgi:phosphoglycolate phosphatase-like HAD superfamily hydrolase
MWRVHRHIGMGGDQIVASLAGEEVERRLGDELRAASAEEFKPMRDECEPLPGARDLVAELRRRGVRCVLASSSGADDLEYFMRKAGIDDLVDDWTTKDDVERSKPHPDIAGTDDAVMVGDSRWDIEAAGNAGLPTICVITGGWSIQELRDYGAVAVYESLADLTASLDSTPLGAP